MKKLLIILVLLLTACSNNNYNDFVKKASSSPETSDIPFDINFYIDDTDDIIYQVIIDNPDYDLNDVKAIVIHDKKTKNAFPSIGVVDDTIDINDTTKGINLIGYVEKQDLEFKVYIETNNTSYTYIYRYNMPN